MLSDSGMRRSRGIYAGALLLMIILGLPTRLFSESLPQWMVMYVGDMLWAASIFLLIGVVFPCRKIPHVVVMALVLTWGIEFSQLYQAEGINAIRSTRMGGLILGYGFLWSDLIAYTVGIVMGFLLERCVLLPLSRRYSSIIGSAG